MVITEQARAALQSLLSRHPGKALRLSHSGYGWGCPDLKMALDVPSARDEVFEQDGITLVISRLDLRRIPDVRIEVWGDMLVARAVRG